MFHKHPYERIRKQVVLSKYLSILQDHYTSLVTPRGNNNFIESWKKHKIM